MFTWETFDNHWDPLLRDFAERREKQLQKLTLKKSLGNHILYKTSVTT